jgi:hypothetical protein
MTNELPPTSLSSSTAVVNVETVADSAPLVDVDVSPDPVVDVVAEAPPLADVELPPSASPEPPPDPAVGPHANASATTLARHPNLTPSV